MPCGSVSRERRSGWHRSWLRRPLRTQPRSPAPGSSARSRWCRRRPAGRGRASCREQSGAGRGHGAPIASRAGRPEPPPPRRRPRRSHRRRHGATRMSCSRARPSRPKHGRAAGVSVHATSSHGAARCPVSTGPGATAAVAPTRPTATNSGEAGTVVRSAAHGAARSVSVPRRGRGRPAKGASEHRVEPPSRPAGRRHTQSRPEQSARGWHPPTADERPRRLGADPGPRRPRHRGRGLGARRHSQNYHQSFAGRRAVLVSGVAALLIGAAPILINFFFHTGTGLH